MGMKRGERSGVWGWDEGQGNLRVTVPADTIPTEQYAALHHPLYLV